jgi:hypothetical protein
MATLDLAPATDRRCFAHQDRFGLWRGYMDLCRDGKWHMLSHVQRLDEARVNVLVAKAKVAVLIDLSKWHWAAHAKSTWPELRLEPTSVLEEAE